MLCGLTALCGYFEQIDWAAVRDCCLCRRALLADATTGFCRSREVASTYHNSGSLMAFEVAAVGIPVA